MTNAIIPPSELIINPDGTVFHLHINEGYVADTVILVGDPGRADAVSKMFDSVELSARNREFVTHRGTYHGRAMTVVSTGIGCDNIDIVMTELDAAVNVDLKTRQPKPHRRSLRVVRLGTSGAVQPDLKIGDFLLSTHSVGLDGLAFFYADSEKVRSQTLENNFKLHMNLSPNLASPYIVPNDPELITLFQDFTVGGLTISASGFYAPQGRVVRLPLAQPDFLERIESFACDGRRVTNFEMEGAAIALLGGLLGHKTLTVCAIIAQRTALKSEPDYSKIVNNLLTTSLDLLAK